MIWLGFDGRSIKVIKCIVTWNISARWHADLFIYLGRSRDECRRMVVARSNCREIEVEPNTAFILLTYIPKHYLPVTHPVVRDRYCFTYTRVRWELNYSNYSAGLWHWQTDSLTDRTSSCLSSSGWVASEQGEWRSIDTPLNVTCVCWPSISSSAQPHKSIARPLVVANARIVWGCMRSRPLRRPCSLPPAQSSVRRCRPAAACFGSCILLLAI